MNISEKLNAISRRDLFRLSKQFGISSTLLATGAFGGAMSLTSLAKAAESTYEKRFANEPRHTLKFGASGFNARNLLIERAGCLEFARDLEERTEGEIRVEFIGDNQICGQLSCVEKDPAWHRRHLRRLDPELRRRRALPERARLRLHVPGSGVAVPFPVQP